MHSTLLCAEMLDSGGAVKAATFHFLNPFFGVSIAAVILSEPLGVSDYLGVLIVTIGILLVQTSKQSS